MAMLLLGDLTNAKHINSKKGFLKKIHSRLVIRTIINSLNKTFSYFFLFLTNPIINSSVMVRKKYISKILFNESIMYRASEDYLLWIKIYDKTKPFYIYESLVKYRIHENNISNDLYKNLNRCVLIMKNLKSKNTKQFIFKTFGKVFYSLRVMIYRLANNNYTK